MSESELKNRSKYWTLLYHYAEELRDPASLTEEEIEYIQGSVSNCKRPPRGWEYRKDDSVQAPTVHTSTYFVEEEDEFAGTYANE